MKTIERPNLREMIVTSDEYIALKQTPSFVIVMATPEGNGDNYMITYWYNDGGPAPMCLKLAA